jgi:hypothetical protein
LHWGDKLITEKIGTIAGEIFDIGWIISFVAAAKLQSKKVPIPTGSVMIYFDHPTGQYQITLWNPKT